MFSECDKEERLLIERCLHGDSVAWDKLVELHRPKIAGIVKWPKWRFDPHEVEDVIQDSLLQLVNSLKTFRFEASLGTFIHRITQCACIERIRKKTASKRDADCVPIGHGGANCDDIPVHIPVDPANNQEELLLGKERISLLKRALAALDKRCKELVRFRFFEDMSFQEVAERLNEKPNTLVVQLRRCLDKLMKLCGTEGL